MAARVDGSGEYLRRSAALPASTAFTIAGWARRRSSQDGTQRWFLSVEDGAGTQGVFMGWNSSNAMRVISFSTATSFASAPAVDTWFFFAFTSDGANINGYWADQDDTSFVTATASFGTAFTSGVMYIGSDSFDEWTDMALAGVKVWDATLTSTQLTAERWTLQPKRWTNIHAWWPLFEHTQLADYSGNGKTLTAGGTLSTESGPPLGPPYGYAAGWQGNYGTAPAATGWGRLISGERNRVVYA